MSDKGMFCDVKIQLHKKIAGNIILLVCMWMYNIYNLLPILLKNNTEFANINFTSLKSF